MANWSTDNYFIGRLPKDGKLSECHFMQEKQMTLRALRFDDPEAELPYIINSIDMVGPAVLITGDGKYGCGAPLAQEFWDACDSGIIVFEGHGPYDEEVTRVITINREQVFLEQQSMFPASEEELDTFEVKFTKFEGRTPQEKQFFDQLWAALDKKVRA